MSQFVVKSISSFQSVKLIGQKTSKGSSNQRIVLRRFSQHSNIEVDVLHMFVKFAKPIKVLKKASTLKPLTILAVGQWSLK